MHNFQNSLAKGKIGETLILKLMPELTALNGRKSDFVNLTTEELYELKTDSYDMAKTSNFFIETYSDIDKNKIGGCWQALEHGSKYWMYLFIKNKTLFIFDTALLVQYLNSIVNNYKPINIPNVAWTTQGIKVPRSDLWHLYTERNFNE